MNASTNAPAPWVSKAVGRLFESRLETGIVDSVNFDRAAMEELLQGAFDAGRAVNAHEKLVAALKALLGDGGPLGQSGHIDYAEAVKMARAALALAGEE